MSMTVNYHTENDTRSRVSHVDAYSAINIGASAIDGVWIFLPPLGIKDAHKLDTIAKLFNEIMEGQKNA